MAKDYWLQLTITSVVVLAAIGCGDARPNRVPVSGRVLIDQAPVEGAFIKFLPPEGRPAIGETDADGRFQLTCFEPNDGATLGTHQVIVIAMDQINGSTRRWRVPRKYSEAASSGLEVAIDGPRDDLTLALTWDGGSPFIERDTSR